MPIAEKIRHVVDKAGGSTKLAYALGLRPPAIYGWTRVPSRFVDKVSELTGIPPQELRPDLYPPHS